MKNIYISKNLKITFMKRVRNWMMNPLNPKTKKLNGKMNTIMNPEVNSMNLGVNRVMAQMAKTERAMMRTAEIAMKIAIGIVTVVIYTNIYIDTYIYIYI